MSKEYKCLFDLHKYCIVMNRVEPRVMFGDVEFVKLYCSMCVKARYAKAKFKLINRYSVVNTL